MKLVNHIKKAKGSKKDELYLSIYGADRKDLLQEIILQQPIGAYPRKHLVNNISEQYGLFASLDVTQKFLRGMASIFPHRIITNFTLGLDEITLKK